MHFKTSMPLLIFFLLELSITDRRSLQSPPSIVNLFVFQFYLFYPYMLSSYQEHTCLGLLYLIGKLTMQSIIVQCHNLTLIIFLFLRSVCLKLILLLQFSFDQCQCGIPFCGSCALGTWALGTVPLRLCCFMACGILQGQGSDPCSQHLTGRLSNMGIPGSTHPFIFNLNIQM